MDKHEAKLYSMCFNSTMLRLCQEWYVSCMMEYGWWDSLWVFEHMNIMSALSRGKHSQVLSAVTAGSSKGSCT